MDGFFKALTTDQFEDKEIIPVQHPTKPFRISVVKRKDKFYGIKNVCPHQGSPLHTGTVHDIEDMGVCWGTVLFCPKHGWGFQLENGKCDSNQYIIDTFTVKTVDNLILVSLEPSNAEIPGIRRDFGGREG